MNLKRGNTVKWCFNGPLYAIVQILTIKGNLYEIRMLYNNYGALNKIYHWPYHGEKIETLTKKDKLEFL